MLKNLMASHSDDMLEIYGAQMLEHFTGVDITFQQDMTEIEVSAVAEDVEYSIAGDDGREVKRQYRDYMIAAAELVESGEPIEPRVGDLIKESIGGRVRTFEAVRRNDKPAVELLFGGYRWLIHTMQVDE